MFIIENTILSIAYTLIHAIRYLVKGTTTAQCKALLRLAAAPLAFIYVSGYSAGEFYVRARSRLNF